MSTSSQQNVYIVDDDEASRDSISTLLKIVGFSTHTFESGRDFLAMAKSLPPGCLVSDVRMPELDGMALLAQLKMLGLEFPVVFVTGHGDIQTAVRAIKAGAVDFVEKPFDGGAMISAVRAAQIQLASPERDDELSEVAETRVATLSPREYEVLTGLVAGKSNKELARGLGISPRTVEFHRSRVMSKMQAQTLSVLVRLGLAAGLDIDI